MNAFDQYEVWFVTGAQLLYGGDAVIAVDAHSNEMVAGLNNSGKLPVKVVYKGTANSSKEVEAVMNDYYNAKDKLGDMQNFYALTENADDSMGRFIKDMETYMPADSAVTALSIAAGSVNFNITAASKESVAKFIIQLKNLDYVSDVVAGALSESEDTSGVKTVNYTLTCTFTKVAEE